jgi:hypothetical protein
MADPLISRVITVSQAVLLHNSTRSIANCLNRYSRPPLDILLSPIRHLNSALERTVLVALIELEPRCPDEAREKLVYLMAVMSSNAAALPLRDVQRAIDTLRPFRSDLAEALIRRAPGTANEVGKGSPPTPKFGH